MRTSQEQRKVTAEIIVEGAALLRELLDSPAIVGSNHFKEQVEQVRAFLTRCEDKIQSVDD